MNKEQFTKEDLWQILVETAHAMIMFTNHKAYTRDMILHENPNIDPTELAIKLHMPLGEALVILDELAPAKEGEH